MRQKIKQILCPYDGTSSSEFVFKKILPVARIFGARIVILTCIEDKATLGFFKLESDKKMIEKQKKIAERKIEELKKLAQNLGIVIKSKIVKCDIISKEIVNHAKKEKIDIIAMSKSKCGTTAERMYTESTVDKVFKESPCSFLHLK